MFVFAKSNRFYFFTYLFIFVLSHTLNAQIDSLAESLIHEDDEQGDLLEWIDLLETSPVDINTASEKNLNELPFLNSDQVELILRNRPFSTKKEISDILGKTTYLQIRSFIVLNKSLRLPQWTVTHRQQHTLEKNRAMKDNLFLGTDYETLTRLQVKLPGHISGGVLTQKDKGEARFDDHFSGYLTWNPPEFPLKIIAGNFNVHSAEGLIFSAAYLPSKRTLIEGPIQMQSGILKPNLSSNECDGFSGVALQWDFTGLFGGGAFFSDQYKDAVLDDTSNAILRFERTGYHRNMQELQTVNRVHEKSIGLSVSFSLAKNATIGMVYSKTIYHPGFEYLPSEEKIRDRYRFEGSSICNYSLFYAMIYNEFSLRGEFIPLNRSVPVQQHSLRFGQKSSSFLLQFSYLPTSFNSPYGRHLSDSQPFPRSLQQFLLGFLLRSSENFTLSAYCSMDKDIWRTYFNPLPLLKKSSEIEAIYIPLSGTQLMLRYQYSSSYQYQSSYAICRSADKLRLQIEKKPNSRFRFRSRIEKLFVKYSISSPEKQGFSFYQDFNWQHSKIFSLSIRFSSFQSDDYDSRLYEYESSIPGAYTNYPLYGSGNKYYLLLSCSPSSNLKIWFKYRQINYDAVEQIGSGLTAIEGSIRQDLQFQIEFRY
jgi:hypothetical protein